MYYWDGDHTNPYLTTIDDEGRMTVGENLFTNMEITCTGVTISNIGNLDTSVSYYGYRYPEIDKVIFNDPATIVIWKDKTKTVVKCHNEPYDLEKGLAMCIAKKVLGEKFHSTFREWCGGNAE